MKTLTIFLIFLGVFSFNCGFSYTLINLPVEDELSSPVDNVFVAEVPKLNYVIDVDKPKIEPRNNFEDTIVVYLDEVVITDGFPEQAHACLQKHIKYPEFARKQKIEGVVALRIMFDRNGVLNILESFSNDPRLLQYVLGEMQVLQPKNCSVDIGKDYNLRFSFRLY